MGLFLVLIAILLLCGGGKALNFCHIEKIVLLLYILWSILNGSPKYNFSNRI